MPIKDVIQNWEIGIWSFCIIATGVLALWGLLFIFNQHHRMKTPTGKMIVAGLSFIAILFLWFFLTALERISGEVRDMRNAAISRENGGLHADILLAAPATNTNAPFPTNYITTLSSMSSSPENRSILSGADMDFVLHVYNSGEPTTAWGFQALIILPGPDEKKMDAIIPSVVLSSTGTLGTIPTAAGMFSANAENFLLNALAFNPMPTGGAANYWLTVHVNGLNPIPVGTKIIITFHDVYGRETKIQDDWVPNQQ